MNFEMPKETFETIAELIRSDDSPVGIDAKKTHVLILHKLASIEERLRRLEEAGRGEGRTSSSRSQETP